MAWKVELGEVLRAVEQLREACAVDEDARRASTATWLAELFAEVTDAGSLRQSAREALTLYTGGAGSFQDVGSSTMAASVDELHSALLGASRI